MPSTIKYLALFLITAALSGAVGYGIGIEAGIASMNNDKRFTGWSSCAPY